MKTPQNIRAKFIFFFFFFKKDKTTFFKEIENTTTISGISQIGLQIGKKLKS